MIIETFVVSEDEVKQRLDAVLLHRYPDFSRAHLQKMVKTARILVSERMVKTGYKLRLGDKVEVQIDAPSSFDAKPEDIPLDILYEDEHLLCVNKPAPMVVYPSPGHREGVLVNAVLNHYPDLPNMDGAERPGVVHRLDKDTSGCILLSKTAESHIALLALFKARKIKKHYIAICHGEPSSQEGIVDEPIGRSTKDWISMRLSKLGKQALTNYKVRSINNGISLIDAYPHTGRMHQIRLHLTHLGCPILADSLYGKEKSFYLSSLGKNHTKKETALLTRHALHASEITLEHPITNKLMTIQAPMAEDMQLAIDSLGL